jgi:hypothetical protein
VAPAHPIVLPPEQPPTGGEKPTHPIYYPVAPEHPIVLPPVVIWPGPGPLPAPEHPIVLPEPPKSFTVIIRDNSTGEWKTATFVPGSASPPTYAPGPKGK